MSIEEYLSVGLIVLINVVNVARYRTVVRGWCKGKYVIVDCPLQDGVPVMLRRSQGCVIRFISKGTACGFDTQVVERGSVEAPLMRLGWPQKVELIRIRKHERVDMQFPCTVHCQDGSRLVSQVYDLSAGGCKVLSPQSFPLSTVLSLSFNLPDGSAIEGLEMTVCSVAKRSDGALLGCRFDEANREALYDIEFYVTTTLERQRFSADSGKRVLIIEHDERIAGAIEEAVERYGHTATVASGAIEGFFRMRTSSPSLVLANFELPELTGIEMCRALRKSTRFEDTPFFVYGGEPELAELQAQDAGAQHYFPPSAGPDKMASELTRFLRVQDRAT